MLQTNERELWIKRNYRSMEAHMKISLASIYPRLMPQLVIDLDDESWTDNTVVHIGIGEVCADDADELTEAALFLTGHECQHVLSTTNKAWEHGIKKGMEIILEEYASRHGGRVFRKDQDYANYVKELAASGIKISVPALQKFSHFIANSLEDGRIERIRCIERPGFRPMIVRYRGKEWERTPVSKEMRDHIQEPGTYLYMILNQVLSLATMSIYQKGFLDASKSSQQLLETVNSLIPEISYAVNAESCRECMEHSIRICRMLAEEIMNASRKSALEEILESLFQMLSDNNSYTATEADEHRNGKTGDSLFGHSDLFIKMDQDTYDQMIRDGKLKEGENGNIHIIITDAKKEKDADKKSADKEDDSESSGLAQNDEPDNKPEGSGNHGQPGNSAGNAESPANGKQAESSGNPEEAADNFVKEAMADAKEDAADSVEDINNSSYQNMMAEKASRNSDVEDTESRLPDLSDVDSKYDEKVEFTEHSRWYQLKHQMPYELMGQAKRLRRSVEKILRNRQKPCIRGQKRGRIDNGYLYKIVLGQMDAFSKKAVSEEFDGCAYLLMDNSGSMSSNNKRLHCCQALSIIEYAFMDMMPVKITAFDAGSRRKVDHEMIKNWNEKLSSNGSYNFLQEGPYTGNTGSRGGNKDGYSIRVATQELLARSERKKILVILSDGMPTEYSSEAAGRKDVHDAVEKARKEGIFVVSIFFGEEQRTQEIQNFRDMYERNCIITRPDLITDELIRILKNFAFR